MNRLIILVITIFILAGCASKRFAKKGAEFETVGFFDKAAEMYYMAVVKNEKNVEAHVGLKRAGQITLNNQLESFLNNYKENNTEDAVYQFIEADNLYKKLKKVGTDLAFPNHYHDYYNELKNSFLNNKYNEGSLLLDEENFAEAEKIFIEIISIEPNYYDTKKLKNIAHYEPIYRQAFENYNAGKYRSAYYHFNEVNSAMSMYKQASEFEKKALDKATMTIAILNFKNLSGVSKAEISIQNEVKKEVINIRSPFIKVVDKDMSGFLKEEQIYNIEGQLKSELSAKAGKLLGAKFLISGTIQTYSIKTSQLKKTVQKGYRKEKIIKKANGEEIEVIKYHKTNYNEYNQSRKVYCRFTFSLISAETSEIIISDAFTVSQEDNIHYATYNGDKKNLYPGTWKSKSKDSPSDEIHTSKTKYNSLQHLFRASKNLDSVEKMRRNIDKQIASKVAYKIKKYDPEK